MKKSISIIFTLALAVLLSNGLLAQDVKKRDAQKQNVSFENTSKSFGLIMEGETVSTTFALKNTGEKPITISKVSTSCGCTSPTFSKDPIKKGEKGKVELVFNSKGRMGAFSKSAIVKFSDGTQQTLKIKGEVYKEAVSK